MIDKTTFYEHIRGGHLFPTLKQVQVDGMEPILDCWNHGPEGLFKPPVYDPMLAYMLATVYHETARSMQPVKEGDWPGHHTPDSWRKVHLRYFPYYGRGLVQLTWKQNYEKATHFLRQFYPDEASQIDLTDKPEQALNSKYSVAILFYGMSTGMFTGKSLHTFIHGNSTDFLYARQIINGMDRAPLIAGYATTFMEAVKAGTEAYRS